MATVYRIKDWQKTFENNKSRIIKRPAFVFTPNNHQSLAINALLSMDEGLAAFGLFNLLVQLASRKEERDGWLTDDGTKDGKPITSQELSLLFHRGVCEIDRLLQILMLHPVCWLQAIETSGHGTSVPSSGTLWSHEQNRTEPNRTERNQDGCKFSEAKSPRKSSPKGSEHRDSKKLNPLIEHKILDEAFPSIIKAMKDHGHKITLTEADERKWRDELRKAVKIDKHDERDIADALQWIFSPDYKPDPDFSWATVIQSLAGIRRDKGNGSKIAQIITRFKKSNPRRDRTPGHHQSQMKPLSKEDGDNLPW